MAFGELSHNALAGFAVRCLAEPYPIPKERSESDGVGGARQAVSVNCDVWAEWRVRSTGQVLTIVVDV